jgi:hypothetical protein
MQHNRDGSSQKSTIIITSNMMTLLLVLGTLAAGASSVIRVAGAAEPCLAQTRMQQPQ